MRAFEIGHVGGLPSAVLHALTGHWILGPWESNLKWTERWARPYFEEAFPIEGAYIFILARKKSDLPIEASLPLAKPFTLQELSTEEEIAAFDDASIAGSSAVPSEYSPEITISPVAAVSAEEEMETAALADESDIESPGSSLNWRPVLTGIIAGLIFLFAYWGQSALQDVQDEPGTGLGWFGLSALMIILLVWYQGSTQFARPNIRLSNLWKIPQRRWLYPFALLLALIAPRFVVQDGQQRTGIALLLWLVAIGTAIFALTEERSSHEETKSPQTHGNLQFDITASVLLFLAALLPRLFQLSSHPFILNGTEASIGLDVLNVIHGTSKNPFSTAWLSNPTLPLYVLAIPIRLLGPTTFAVRLISPFIGSVTVAAVYLLGQQLYGRTIALIAAILLLGSHFHIHYSRLGLTNAWDALSVLLSLGFIAIAWNSECGKQPFNLASRRSGHRLQRLSLHQFSFITANAFGPVYYHSDFRRQNMAPPVAARCRHVRLGSCCSATTVVTLSGQPWAVHGTSQCIGHLGQSKRLAQS